MPRYLHFIYRMHAIYTLFITLTYTWNTQSEIKSLNIRSGVPLVVSEMQMNRLKDPVQTSPAGISTLNESLGNFRPFGIYPNGRGWPLRIPLVQFRIPSLSRRWIRVDRDVRKKLPSRTIINRPLFLANNRRKKKKKKRKQDRVVRQLRITSLVCFTFVAVIIISR